MNDVRKLMGFLNYYRQYIEDLSRIAKPIYDLVKTVDKNKTKASAKRKLGGQPHPSQPIIWTSNHQKVLDGLDECLVSLPVMAYPEPHIPYVLHTDASESGLSAVLYKQLKNALRVFAYSSRTLTAADKNYDLISVKWEFVAQKWAICE